MLVLLGQYLGLGTGTSLGGVVQITDAANWQSCASAWTTFNAAPESDWCARRPLGVLFMSPLISLAAGSTASIIVLQTVMLVMANLWLVWTAARYMEMPLWAANLIAILLIWPTFIHGSGLTLEGLGMMLATCSLALWIRGFATRSSGSVVFAISLMVLAFLIRPGNPLLVSYMLLLAVIFIIRGRKESKAAIIGLVGALALLAVGPPLMQLAMGTPPGAASGNVWSSIYVAATPESDYWPSAYAAAEELVPQGAPDWEYSIVIRDKALELLRSDPLPFVRQMITNGASFLDSGVLNLALVNPVAPPADGLTLTGALSRGISFHAFVQILAVLLWAASWLLLPLFAYVLLVQFRTRRFFDTGEYGALRLQVVTLGLAASIGAWMFFVVLGHDEQKRHLAQSIPFLVLALVVALVVLVDRKRTSPRVVATSQVFSASWLASFFVVLAVVGLALIVEGRRPGTTVIAQVCSSADQQLDRWGVVSAVGVDVSPEPDFSPSSWRMRQPFFSHLEHSNESWFRDRVRELPRGVLVQLRSADGRVIPAFLTDIQLTDLDSGGVVLSECLSRGRPDSATGRLGLWTMQSELIVVSPPAERSASE